ncbi:MAG: hypothetical protein WBD50_05850 [Candidatus Rhabdochlamydia sp.]
MRWLICFLCFSLTVCAEDKKKPRPRQVQAHYVGAGRPKNQMTKKKSPTDKYFLSKTTLKKRKQKKIAKKTENQEERPFYQKSTDVDKSLIVK